MMAAVWLSIKLASLTSAILLLIALPLAAWLVKSQAKWRVVIDAIIALPMVLPPTVLGFYLLMLFSPNQWLGGCWLAIFGQPLTFSFQGLVIASVLYSLPFAVQPLKQGFAAIPLSYDRQAKAMGLTQHQYWRQIALPLLKPSMLIALVMVFAHTIGEFGVVLMIGGNMVGETKVVSIELFELVELMQYQQAHYLAGGLLLASLLMLIPVYGIWGRIKRHE